MGEQPAWVPESCTLPTVQQPLRVAEFDEMFSTSLRSMSRPDTTHLHLVLDPFVEEKARELTARESACCSFFVFTLARSGHDLHLDVEVPAAHVAVLDALAARASTSRTSSRVG